MKSEIICNMERDSEENKNNIYILRNNLKHILKCEVNIEYKAN